MIPLELLQFIKILILPPALQFLLLLLGALLLRRHRRAAMLCITLGLGSLYLLSTGLVAGQLTARVEVYPPLDLSTAALQQAEAIVILGAGRNSDAPEYAGDTVSSRELERLRYGAILHDKTGLPILLTGGRVLEDGPSEAQLMQQALQQSFQRQALWLEQESRNTRENARFSFALLQQRHINRVILVTHASHMPRAVLRFEQAGFSVIPAPTVFQSNRSGEWTLIDLLPSAAALHVSTITLHEIYGLMAVRLGP